MNTPSTDKFSCQTSIAVRAKAGQVWEALTDPALIKQYLYGTDAISDWKVGSPIAYRGEWDGRPYEDKGTVLEVIPNKLLQTSYWSAFSGLEDRPENYLIVSYALSESDGGTTLTITTENIPTQDSADHVAENWAQVLQALKELLEK
jgi:uncharacterized protein YndB with AHSA1/START domain